MAEYDIGKTTTTDLKGSVLDVKIASQTPDQVGSGEKEVRWNFPDADKQLGYLQQIPELKSALQVYAKRVAGLGYTTDLGRDQVVLEGIVGHGKETITSILMQLIIEVKIFGDVFAEIIRNDKGTLINLKKLYTGDMTVFFDNKGLIKRYEQRSNTEGGIPKKFETNEIFHLSNDRVGNEIHGTSIIDSLKVYIDFYNELVSDERKIRHKDLAMGMLKIESNDDAKRQKVMREYKNAIKNGEVLVIGDGVELIDNPVSPRDRIQIMQFVINQFYQVIGTPKVLVTSEGFTEAGGKAGLISFEPTELSAKKVLEEEFWNQLAIRFKLVKTPSLLGEEQETQQKNAGQVGIQKNETQVTKERTE